MQTPEFLSFFHTTTLMLDTLKLGFIGGGNMAAALIGGLIAKGAHSANIVVVDPTEPARSRGPVTRRRLDAGKVEGSGKQQFGVAIAHGQASRLRIALRVLPSQASAHGR